MITILILTIIIILLITTLCVLLHKYLVLKNEYELDKSDMLFHKNKISMIEYTYRKFKEGQNPYTTLRQVSDILKDFYPKTPKE